MWTTFSNFPHLDKKNGRKGDEYQYLVDGVCGYFCGYVINVVHKPLKKPQFLGKTHVDNLK